MYVKKNTRVTFRSNRRQGHKRGSSFSNGRGRNKGNITQQYQKYLKLAKEAFSSGDRIQTEYYYQFADHYSRLMVEFGIKTQELDNLNDQTDEKNAENHIKNSEIRIYNSILGHCVANPGNDKGFQEVLDQAVSDLIN